MKVPYETLSKMVFLKGLPEDILREFADAATFKKYSKGEFLIEEYQEAREFFLIRSGEVQICSKDPETGIQKPVQKIGTGEVLGWSWLFAPYVWSFNAVAKSDLEVIMFDAAHIRHFCESHKELGYEVLTRFSKLMSLRMLELRTKYADLQERVFEDKKIA